MTTTYFTMRLLAKFLLIVLFAFVTPSYVLADLIKLETDVGFESVYLLPDSEASTVTVALTIMAGEVDVEGPEGLSHYLEHLMFWHADKAGGQQIHARGGNAWVNGLITSYYNEGEKTDFDDMLEFASRLFDEADLERSFMIRERSVVAREYDVSVSENPDRRIETAVKRDLYNDLPISRSTIGTPQSINSLTIAQASAFHKRFYHPANSVLYISGNLEKLEAEAAVQNHFSGLEPGIRHAARWREASIAESSDKEEVFTDSQVNHERLKYFTLSEWPDSENAIGNWYTQLLLGSVLDSALEGGIARPLRMDNFILSSFGLSLGTYLYDYVELRLNAEPDQGVSMEQATTAIKDTIDSLADSGVPDATLERVRTRLLQTEIRTSSNSDSNYYRMSEQLSSGLNPVTSSQHLEYIKSVSLKDVNELLSSLANPKRRSVAFVKPNGE